MLLTALASWPTKELNCHGAMAPLQSSDDLALTLASEALKRQAQFFLIVKPHPPVQRGTAGSLCAIAGRLGQQGRIQNLNLPCTPGQHYVAALTATMACLYHLAKFAAQPSSWLLLPACTWNGERRQTVRHTSYHRDRPCTPSTSSSATNTPKLAPCGRACQARTTVATSVSLDIRQPCCIKPCGSL
jgi:hypothetical protein